MSKRDLAHDSFNDFSAADRRFPNSRYSPDARRRMIHLRNLLAPRHVADYYIRRKAYVAAASRGRYVVGNFKNPSGRNGLAVMVEAYQNWALDDLAATS